MRVPLNRESEIPLYQQIEVFLRQGIQSGALLPETRLPASRQLAADLGVNRITVENAYAELEADGLVYRRLGSGTFIAPPFILSAEPGDKSDADKAWPEWQQDLRDQRRFPNLPMQAQLREVSGNTSVISFAEGVSDSRLCPAEEFRKVIQTVLRRDGIEAFSYGDRAGYLPLRTTIAHILANQGIPAHADNILITSGSQQALALVVQLLLKTGELILVENPTYAGALDLFRSLGLRIVGIPLDEKGMQVDILEEFLRDLKPRLIYTIPNFQNPTGTCLSGHRRRQLIALANRYNVPILEDDFVGDLRYDGRAQPALKALDPGGRVIMAGTFSKMLMPGLRVGYLVAEGPVYEQLVAYKRVNDLASSNLVQRSLEAYITVGRYQAHLRRACQFYRKRRNAMVAAVVHHLPANVRFHSPQGGLFLWLRLPEGFSSDELFPLALEEGVAFNPGSLFFLDGIDQGWMRLNFTTNSPEVIESGVKRVGRAIQKLMK
jgi:GntR family transcriptional regulator/MocR family aminotransferase